MSKNSRKSAAITSAPEEDTAGEVAMGAVHLTQTVKVGGEHHRANTVLSGLSPELADEIVNGGLGVWVSPVAAVAEETIEEDGAETDADDETGAEGAETEETA
jgi:hypothetical protein